MEYAESKNAPSNQKLIVNTTQNRYQLVKQLILSFEEQVLNGCGNETCAQPSCWTYRRRKSRKPLRRFTRDAARATALALAEEPSAIDKLCCFAALSDARPSQQSDEQNLNDSTKSPDRKQISRSSLSQNLVNTKTMRNVFDLISSRENNNKITQLILTRSLTKGNTLRPLTSSFTDIALKNYSYMSCRLALKLTLGLRDWMNPDLLGQISFSFFRNPSRLFRSFKDAHEIDLRKITSAEATIRTFNNLSKNSWNPPFIHHDPWRIPRILSFWLVRAGRSVLEGLCESLDDIDNNLVSLVNDGNAKDVAHVFFIGVYALGAYCGSTVELSTDFRCAVLRRSSMDSPLAYDLGRKLLRFFDILPQEADVAPTPYQRALAQVFHPFILEQIASIETTFQREFLSPLVILTDVASVVIDREWDRRSIVRKTSAVGKSVNAMGLLGQIMDPYYRWFYQDKNHLEAVINMMNSSLNFNRVYYGYWAERLVPSLPRDKSGLLKIAEEFWNVPKGYFSIVTVFDPFFPPCRRQFFRATCFYRMRRARENAQYYKELIARSLSTHSTPNFDELANLLEKLPTTESGQGLRNVVEYCLTMSIRREFPLDDALSELWRLEKRQLDRPLKVQMDTDAEIAMDFGGVSQEFLRLAVKEMFNPGYGILTIDAESQLAWFDPKSLEPLHKYELLGMLLGLAMFNGFTLPVNFPIMLYIKLCHWDFDAFLSKTYISDGWPDLTRAFDLMLESGDEVSETFVRTYCFSFPTIEGRCADVDMSRTSYDEWSARDAAVSSVDTSEDAPLVTNENREQYVKDYVSWLTDKSIRPQYLAFEKGFNRFITREQLRIVDPKVLKDLLEGTGVYSTFDLQDAARYEGYRPDDSIIKWFWEIVHGFDDEKKTKLLIFVTANERVPPGGAGRMDFHIKRTYDTNRIVTAGTCFHVLNIPPYESKERLAEVLEIALENVEGFGLV